MFRYILIFLVFFSFSFWFVAVVAAIVVCCCCFCPRAAIFTGSCNQQQQVYILAKLNQTYAICFSFKFWFFSFGFLHISNGYTIHRKILGDTSIFFSYKSHDSAVGVKRGKHKNGLANPQSENGSKTLFNNNGIVEHISVIFAFQ